VEREVLTVFDALSNTGGFMSIVFTAFAMIVSGTQENLFFSSIIKRIFLYEPK
jgi:hypothetical protein